MRLSRIVAMVGMAGVLLSSAVGAGATGSEKKTYRVDIDPAASAAGVWAGDADASLSLRITNTSRSQRLGSANVGIPAPFVLVGAPADTVAGGPVLELRDLSLAPGATASFALTVDVQTCLPATVALSSVSAKQSNDFNGTGNDFTLDRDGSDLDVDVTGTCSLAFVDQPASAERTSSTRSVPITSEPFTPDGPAVSVEVRDAGGTDRATHSTATVELSVQNPAISPPPVLGGITSVAGVAGLAVFTPGPTLSVSASGFTLSATSPGLVSSPPSTPFAIVDTRVGCPAASPCAGAATSQRDGTSVTASFGVGASQTDLLLSLDPADAPLFECAGYPRRPDLLVSQFSFSGDQGADRIGRASVTIPNATRPLRDYQVCWAAPYDFMTKSGTSAVPVPGLTKPGTTAALRVGLLPDCRRHRDRDRVATPLTGGTATSIPCVSQRSYNRKTRAVTLTVLTDGRDPWRY